MRKYSNAVPLFVAAMLIAVPAIPLLSQTQSAAAGSSQKHAQEKHAGKTDAKVAQKPAASANAPLLPASFASWQAVGAPNAVTDAAQADSRSEEHTSELQSQ